MNLPSNAVRLFPHHNLAEVERPEYRGFLISRLLEEGDRSDLRWLAANFGEREMRRFLAACGGRRLSCRSRRFFERVLGIEASQPAEAASEVWSL